MEGKEKLMANFHNWIKLKEKFSFSSEKLHRAITIGSKMNQQPSFRLPTPLIRKHVLLIIILTYPAERPEKSELMPNKL